MQSLHLTLLLFAIGTPDCQVLHQYHLAFEIAHGEGLPGADVGQCSGEPGGRFHHPAVGWLVHCIRGRCLVRHHCLCSGLIHNGFFGRLIHHGLVSGFVHHRIGYDRAAASR